MVDNGLKPQQKKGFWAGLSLLQKALLVLGVIIIIVLIAAIVLGGITNFYQFFFYLVCIGVVVVGIYIVLSAASMFFKPKFFSPREDLRTKLLNMAVDYCPDNLGNLFFRGSKLKRRVLAGKIVGCLGLPYYMGKNKTYEVDVADVDGKIIHKKGEVVFSEIKGYEEKKIPIFEDIKVVEGGDTLFIVKKGWFVFAKTHYIRCNVNMHSDLNGDVDISSINTVPYGFFEYPYEQMQESPSKIMIQNMIETVLVTHEHQHDLVSTGCDAAIYYNPFFSMQLKAQAEMGASEE